MHRSIKRVLISVGLASAVVWGSVAEEEQAKISISVQATAMRDVLKFIAEQSDTSIVISPEVSEQMMDVTIKDIPLDEALDVILKPYGCGHSKIGKTVVVDRLENLSRLNEVEPLSSRVFRMKYLDAKGVMKIAESMLSPRGKVYVLVNVQVPGWEMTDLQGNKGLAAVVRQKSDKKDEETASSQTLVVTDTPSSLTRIANVIAELDIRPGQVEIQAHFLEFNDGALRDIGVDWGAFKNSGEFQTGSINPATGATVGDTLGTTFGEAQPSAFPGNELTKISGVAPYNAGLALGLVRQGTTSLEAMLHAVEENKDVNVLSAPRIFAQENQEANILVGEKFPIVSTEQQDTGGSTRITTRLEKYEEIGIKLNVIPQICEDETISMVINPSATELRELKKFNLNEYPWLTTRQVQTRLTVKSGDTIAIGGLVNDRQIKGTQRVPFLGSIPYLGKLFSRDTITNRKVELMVLIKATIMNDPAALGDAVDRRIDLTNQKLYNYWEQDISKKEAADVAEEAPPADPNAAFLDNMSN